MTFFKSKIHTVLLLLLVCSICGTFYFIQYKADTSFSEYRISGNIYKELTKSVLSDVEVCFTFADGQTTQTTKTMYSGNYYLILNSEIQGGTLTFKKDGFFDLVGYINRGESNEININTTLKQGFGREVFANYYFSHGFYPFSIPFTPTSTNPNDLFKRLERYSDSEGLKYREISYFSNEYSKGATLYSENNLGQLMDHTQYRVLS